MAEKNLFHSKIILVAKLYIKKCKKNKKDNRKNNNFCKENQYLNNMIRQIEPLLESKKSVNDLG